MVQNRYFSVLIIKRGDHYLAQALECDIAAQGRSLEEAKIAFERALIGQIQFDRRMGREPLAHLRPAPDRYWHAWRLAAERQGLNTAPLHVEGTGTPPCAPGC